MDTKNFPFFSILVERVSKIQVTRIIVSYESNHKVLKVIHYYYDLLDRLQVGIFL